MGRYSYSSRWTTSDCKSLSVKFLNEHHYFDGGVRWGTCSWSRNGEKTGSIGYVVSTAQGDASIRFQYIHTNSQSDEKKDLDYKVQLVSTPCRFGGRRWWFICPLVREGRPCQRRVGVLYLGGKYFGCRHCYSLTYESSRESHKFDKLFAELGITPRQARGLFS